MSPLSFLVLVICVLSYPGRDKSILLNFSKNKLLVSLVFYMDFLFSFSLISALIISFILLTLCLIGSSFSNLLYKNLDYCLQIFLLFYYMHSISNAHPFWMGSSTAGEVFQKSVSHACPEMLAEVCVCTVRSSGHPAKCPQVGEQGEMHHRAFKCGKQQRGTLCGGWGHCQFV